MKPGAMGPATDTLSVRRSKSRKKGSKVVNTDICILLRLSWWIINCFDNSANVASVLATQDCHSGGLTRYRLAWVGAHASGVLNVGPVTCLATQLLGRTDLGSPHGVTDQDHWVRQLWHITYIFAIPIFVIVMGGIIWCVVRYRVKPGGNRGPPSSSTTSPSRRPTPSSRS